jgi:hypothetical protein
LERQQSLRSKLAAEEMERARSERRLAAMEAELAKLKRLAAHMAGFERDLARALGLPGTKAPDWPKGRRPGRWKGPDGYELVAYVLEFQAAHGSDDIAPAIRALREESKKWRAIKQRDLERRFQEVRRLWEPWWRQSVWLETRLEEALAKM